MDGIQDTQNIFTHALQAVNPSTLLRSYLERRGDDLCIDGHRLALPPEGKLLIAGAGKAAALMAHTAEALLGDAFSGGLVVTPYHHGFPLRRIQCIEAGHPIPDGNSLRASREIKKLVQELTPRDVVLFLLSGGASALLADCPEGLTLAEVQRVYDLLIKSGAGIHQVNVVRKHLSQIKGGQLAQAVYPARLHSFILSDVIGDDPGIVGSGPTAPDCSTYGDALAVLSRYSLLHKIPAAVYRYLLQGYRGQRADTPKAGAECFIRTHNRIIGGNRIALQAAAQKAKAMGYHTEVVTHTLHGEARLLGRGLAEVALQWQGPRPACLLYGGESTVTVRGPGKGGRNMELALAAGMWLRSQPGITLLAAGTDGTDGPTDAAGAVVNADLMKKAEAVHGSGEPYLENNDSYRYFSGTGALVRTGPTHTNVMDMIIIVIW